jgi:hypothetical protein
MQTLNVLIYSKIIIPRMTLLSMNNLKHFHKAAKFKKYYIHFVIFTFLCPVRHKKIS